VKDHLLFLLFTKSGAPGIASSPLVGALPELPGPDDRIYQIAHQNTPNSFKNAKKSEAVWRLSKIQAWRGPNYLAPGLPRGSWCFMFVNLAWHHLTVNLKCPTTRQRRTVIRLYPCCDVQHDPLNVTGIGGLTGSISPFLFLFVGEMWGTCPARTATRDWWRGAD